MEHGEARSMLM
ncbi:unnamed protein product [Leptidea sinapis]|uniref:Uncharacterized protein n=1 Tax=Leptidea sinapis TaxID=189913 RepID=A0A5E4Q8D3_9NEOP|nr:unnamed protein product [Leptidea sinapis]